MRYRKFGRTGIDVGIVGLGAEYLWHEPRDAVIPVVHEAIDRGVNYIDLFMPSADVRDNFGVALKGKRQKVMIAGHLGSVELDGQSGKSRDVAVCERYFHDLLTRLQTDYIDALMLFFVDEPDDYDRVFDSGGLLELALRLKKEGKARFIGMSSHNAPTALKAVNSGYVDVLMFPVNPMYDVLPGDFALEVLQRNESYNQSYIAEDESAPGRKDLYHACAVQNVGVVAMKPYAAGLLLTEGNPSSIVLTPVQCVNYALTQPAVCTVVPGCKSVAEMKAALAYLDAADEERDYSAINLNSVWKLRGSCMYCDHCLPCPVGIDIGITTRIADTAGYEIGNNIIAEYEALPAKADDCIKCGDCVERCPFGVDVIANMARAVDIFGK
ncbi:aldo/keto reductase [Chloroflexota bacterium]